MSGRVIRRRRIVSRPFNKGIVSGTSRYTLFYWEKLHVILAPLNSVGFSWSQRALDVTGIVKIEVLQLLARLEMNLIVLSF